ncbi:MAG: hypothetical protein DMG56_28610, partial [Acidobacteria bacterium]
MKNYALRHQIGVLQRSARKRSKLPHPGFSFAIRTTNLWLANCYFTQDSSGFSVLLRFFDAQSCRSFYPFHRRPGSVARSWREVLALFKKRAGTVKTIEDLY